MSLVLSCVALAEFAARQAHQPIIQRAVAQISRRSQDRFDLAARVDFRTR